MISDTCICHLEAFGHYDDAFEDFIKHAIKAVKLSGTEVVAGSVGPYAAKVYSY